jgi:hypothetical protein
MKYISYLFLLITFFQTLQAELYISSLDAVIAQKVETLQKSSYEIKNLDKVVSKLAKHIKKQPVAQDVNAFLDPKNSILLYFNDQVVLKLNGDLSEEALAVLADFKDLKFAIGAKLYLHYFACCKEKMLYKATRNYDALQYWKNEQFAENLAFYNKNILRWISRSSYQGRIEKNIEALEKVSFKTNSFLGMLCSNQDLLVQSQTEQDFKANLKEVIGIQNELLQVSDDLSCDDMGELVAVSLQQVHHFNDHLSQLYAACQLPSHVARNWKGYTLSTAAVCACAYIYLTYGDVIVESSKYAWNQHARGPIEKAIQAFTGIAQPHKLEAEENRKALEAMMDQELSKPKPRAAKDDITPMEAFLEDANAATDGYVVQAYEETKDIVIANPFTWKGDMFITSIGYQWNRLVATAQEKLKAYPRQKEMIPDCSGLSYEEKKALVLPRIATIIAVKEKNTLRVADAYSIKAELETIQLKETLSSVLKDNHMVMCMAALLPAATVVGGSLFASKNIYNSVAYQPIRKYVRELEVLLNDALYRLPSFDVQGKLYFLVEQLSLNIDVLTLGEQKMMQDDLRSLRNYGLDYVQKYNVIQRMYKTYPCLSAGGW